MKRSDCWCSAYRKPCEYHEGYADGLDEGKSLLRRWLDYEDVATPQLVADTREALDL